MASYTLVLAGESHVISPTTAGAILTALATGSPLVRVEFEPGPTGNARGTDLATAQIIALYRNAGSVRDAEDRSFLDNLCAQRPVAGPEA